MVQPGSRVHIGQWTFQKITWFVHPPSITTLNPTNSRKSQVITTMINTILTLPYVSAILSVVPASGCARCCSSARSSCWLRALGRLQAATTSAGRPASGRHRSSDLKGCQEGTFREFFFGILTGISQGDNYSWENNSVFFEMFNGFLTGDNSNWTTDVFFSDFQWCSWVLRNKSLKYLYSKLVVLCDFIGSTIN